MSIPAKRPEIDPADITKGEISKWLRAARLPKTAANIQAAYAGVTYAKQAERMPIGRDVSIAKADAPRQVVYGQCGVGGVVTFAGIQADNQQLHLAVTFAGHEVEDIYELYLDDWRVDFGGGVPGWCTVFVKSNGWTLYNACVYLEKALGADDQAAIASLTAAGVGWTADHRQRGCALAHVTFLWDANIFGDGLPAISAVVKGKKVYDPRTTTTYYSNNAALCIADYLTDTRFGLGVPWSELDTANIIEAADTCDEAVSLAAGGTEARYTINGWFDCDEAHRTVLDNMAAAIGGSITYSAGKWRIWPAAYRAPTVTLTIDDIVSEINVTTKRSRRDGCNRVKGTYADPLQRYAKTDYPTVVNGTYYAEDGNNELWLDLDQPFVTSAAQCQRLAKIALERNRQGITASIIVTLKAFYNQIPETVALTLARYGWTAKEFEISQMELVELRSGDVAQGIGVALELRETAAAIYTWSAEETTTDLAPNTNLPNPFTVTAPAGLSLTSGTADLYIRGDGTIMTRIKVSWAAAGDYFVLSGGWYELQYKRSADPDWLSLSRIAPSATSTYILDVEDAILYDVRLRAINALGVESSWSTVEGHLVEGKTAAPTDVLTLAAAATEYGIKLVWTPIDDADLLQYEIRVGVSWITSTLIGRFMATTYTYETLAADNYHFMVKAIDTTGHESATEAAADLTITAPAMSSGTVTFAGENVVIDWAESSGSFALSEYLIYYGATFGAATLLGTVKASYYSARVDWAGSRKFWITGRDVYGNEGSPLMLDVDVVSPGSPINLFAKIIDNNVILDWAAPTTGSLPVSKYRIYVGATFGAATVKGDVAATFVTYFETAGGVYYYHVTAIDSAGNEGGEVTIQAIVNEPPDFVLKVNETFTLATGDLTNMILEGGAALGPCNTTETMAEHFGTYDTIDEMIAAGFDYWLEPGETTAQIQRVLDYGTVINGTLITLDWVETPIDGSITVTPTIEYSLLGSVYTSLGDVSQVYCAESFQYVRVTLALAAADNDDLMKISSVRIKIAVHVTTEEGTARAQTSDLTGTEVTFTKDWIDLIGAPVVTPSSLRRVASFNAAKSEYLTCADHDDFSPVAGAFTITVLVRPMMVPSAGCRIIEKWVAAGGNFEYMLFFGADRKFGIWYSSDGTAGSYITADTFGAASLGEWYSVAWYYDGSSTIGIKINDTAPTEAAFSADFINGTAAIGIGGIWDGSGSHFHGELCNLLIMKERISDANLDALHALGIYDYSDLSSTYTTNLKAAYMLDEASGTRYDSTANNHDLTDGNTVLSAILPTFGVADFTDTPNPTTFKAHVFTDSMRRVSCDFKWSARGAVQQS